MITLEAKVPDLLLQQVQELAHKQKVSVDEIVSSALAAQVSAHSTRESAASRARRVHWPKVDEILGRVPDVAPPRRATRFNQCPASRQALLRWNTRRKERQHTPLWMLLRHSLKVRGLKFRGCARAILRQRAAHALSCRSWPPNFHPCLSSAFMP